MSTGKKTSELPSRSIQAGDKVIVTTALGANASGDVGDDVVALQAEDARTDNPHAVTQTQVGLSNVDNTSDADKPVSTAQAAAIDVVQSNLDGLWLRNNSGRLETSSDSGVTWTDLNRSGFTILVASDDADADLKNAAQYVCDGTADEVQIQAAIDAAIAMGGACVELSAGDFAIDAGITMTGDTVLSFKGQGNSTILNPATGVTVFDVTNPDFVAGDKEQYHFSDFFIRANAGITGVIGFELTLCHNASIQNVLFNGIRGTSDMIGIQSDGINNYDISGCTFLEIENAIRLVGSAQDHEDLRIVNNSFDYQDGTSVYIEGAANTAHKILIANNTFEDEEGVGIHLKNASNCVILGNILSQKDTGILLEGSDSNRIGFNLVREMTSHAIRLIAASTSNTILGNQAEVSGNTPGIVVEALCLYNEITNNGSSVPDIQGAYTDRYNLTYLDRVPSSTARYMTTISGNQIRFAGRPSDNGGGSSDIVFLVELTDETANDCALAVNAPAGRGAAVYLNAGGVYGWKWEGNATTIFTAFGGVRVMELDVPGQLKLNNYGNGTPDFPETAPVALAGFASNGDVGEVDHKDLLTGLAEHASLSAATTAGLTTGQWFKTPTDINGDSVLVAVQVP